MRQWVCMHDKFAGNGETGLTIQTAKMSRLHATVFSTRRYSTDDDDEDAGAAYTIRQQPPANELRR